MRDLWRHLMPDRAAGWLRLWWVCWLAANAIARVVARDPERVSVASFKGSTTADAVSDVIYLVAAVLALRIVRTLTRVALARSAREVSAASPGA